MSNKNRAPKKKLSWMAWLAVGAIIASCGGNDATDVASSDAPTTLASGVAAKGAPEFAAVASGELKSLYAAESFTEPPSDSPPPAADLNVWLIPFGLAAPEGADWVAAAERAAKVLGWETTVFDGEFTPDQYLEGVRLAIADGADAIALYVIDCAPIRAALEEADAADVLVVAAQGADCSDADPSAPSLFDASVNYTQGSFAEWGRALGAAQATWIIAETGGAARAIELYETDAFITIEMHKGFVERMAACGTCEIVRTVEFLATDFGQPLQDKVDQALLAARDANSMAVPYDGVMTAGVSGSIDASGRSDSLSVIAGVGLEANLDLIREGLSQDAGYGVSIGWEAYAAMDTVNRLANKAPTDVPSGNGIAIFDKKNGLPNSGAWAPPIDYVAVYESAWKAAAK